MMSERIERTINVMNIDNVPEPMSLASIKADNGDEYYVLEVKARICVSDPQVFVDAITKLTGEVSTMKTSIKDK